MSEQKTSTDGLMKIGELAKAANVNVSTLKFYVKEELIRPALKTGRNMSWYSPDCVATIRAIRMLQRERFYPLSVIKHLLSSSGAGSPPELALLDAIHKVDYRTTGDGARPRRRGAPTLPGTANPAHNRADTHPSQPRHNQRHKDRQKAAVYRL